jgi:hypothetical protein
MTQLAKATMMTDISWTGAVMDELGKDAVMTELDKDVVMIAREVEIPPTQLPSGSITTFPGAVGLVERAGTTSFGEGLSSMSSGSSGSAKGGPPLAGTSSLIESKTLSAESGDAMEGSLGARLLQLALTSSQVQLTSTVSSEKKNDDPRHL